MSDIIIPRSVRKLEIINPRIAEGKKKRIYSLIANGITLKVEVPMEDVKSQTHEDLMKAVNDRFLQSLRYIKHVGNLPRTSESTKAEMDKMLNKLSTTEWGIGVRPKNDDIKEFYRFQ